MRFADTDIRRAMVIYAHPDDAEWMAGGTVAAWSDAGVEMTYVLVTNGGSGSSDPGMTRSRLTEIRMVEQQEACDVLGVKNLVKLGFEDGYLYPDLDVRKAVAREIRRYRPDAVITHDPTSRTAMGTYVNHPDHLATGEVVLRSINPDASSGLMFPELWHDEGLEPFLPTLLLLNRFTEGEAWVDISSTLDRKAEALLCHRSQMQDPAGTEDWMRQRFGENGKRFGVAAAESFVMMRVGEES